MRHNLAIEGIAYRLRPIADDDAQFVIDLRSDPQLGRHLHPGARTIEEQLAWFAGYYERFGDYYFVVEKRADGRREGLVSIYGITPDNDSGEWGRWILKDGSLAAVESAWLIYRLAFEVLHLNSIYCRTVAENNAVVSFHDSCGITLRKLLPEQFLIDGRHVDAIEHTVDRSSWARIAPRLRELTKLTARRISHA